MKAIILAGGHGSRLLPLTENKNKTMVELNGIPIIDYILNSIEKTNVEEITIVANKFIDDIKNHVGDKAKFVLEEKPLGVANAINLAREGNEKCPIMLWFADNLTNIELDSKVSNFSNGALLLAREVDDPRAFGVAILENGEIVDIVEKPAVPESNLAIGGIYLFDDTFWDRFDLVCDNDDFSISSITSQYVKEGKASIISIGDNSWIDCGTPENLQIAENLVKDGIF